MAQQPIPMKVSNRKAREARLPEFDALAAFANMGDTPQDWENFRRRYPDFFPDYLTEWMYRTTNYWWRLLNLSETPPDDWMEFHQKWPNMFPATTEDWAQRAAAIREAMSTGKPPLLLYRNLLRQVWWNDDTDGNRLRFLLGFESEAFRGGGFSFGMWKLDDPPEPPADLKRIRSVGESSDSHVRVSDLPEGRPIIDGVTGAIKWSFGCKFQSTIYDLMQDRWRAKECPECHKLFIADKTAQKFCSTSCSDEKKREQSNEYYHRKGKATRQERKAARAKSRSQRRTRQ